ncbi:LysR substrate-binding domain-containing protein [Prescottella defluvii]|nr:LysR substrate-binding domain-containing protein [Prescottella defluvii]
MHVAQSALSHQVRQLEHELGTPLFTRTNRRVELTDAGESFVLRAREVLAATDRLHGEVSATGRPVTGTLRIGTITTLTQIDLAALIRAFLDTHPGVDVHVTSSMSEAIVEQVENGELDLGFIGLWHTRPRADLTARVLGTEQLVAVVGRDHPWAGRAAVTLRDLAEVPTVELPEGTGARRQSDDAFAMAGLPERSSPRLGRRRSSPRSPRQVSASASYPNPTPSPAPSCTCSASRTHPSARCT